MLTFCCVLVQATARRLQVTLAEEPRYWTCVLREERRQ